jgi:hypothetical protein
MQKKKIKKKNKKLDWKVNFIDIYLKKENLGNGETKLYIKKFLLRKIIKYWND